MSFSAQDVKDLREKTGAGIMDCKKSLEEAGGDMKKAEELVKARGLAKAEKKADRETHPRGNVFHLAPLPASHQDRKAPQQRQQRDRQR